MKRRFGDRRDGRMIREIDSMHVIIPILQPGRTNNEAFLSETLDLTKTKAFLDAKNAEMPEYKYNIFQVIVAALFKTCILRPQMNRFIKNKYLYQRNELTAAFTVKKIFADDGEEGLAVLKGEKWDTFESIHQKLFDVVSKSKKADHDESTEVMDIFSKVPRPVTKFGVNCVKVLDKYGLVPQSFITTDPYHASVLVSNLGSIKLHAGYHHLSNWGTNSVFVVIGEMKKRPFFDDEGNVTMKHSIDLGITLDERIADGYYFSKTMKLMKKLIENPELLEMPFEEEVDYENV